MHKANIISNEETTGNNLINYVYPIYVSTYSFWSIDSD